MKWKVGSNYGAANSLNRLANRLANRKGEFWYRALTVDNDSAAAYLPVTIKGKLLGAGSSGEDVVAQQAGNLLYGYAEQDHFGVPRNFPNSIYGRPDDSLEVRCLFQFKVSGRA